LAASVRWCQARKASHQQKLDGRNIGEAGRTFNGEASQPAAAGIGFRHLPSNTLRSLN